MQHTVYFSCTCVSKFYFDIFQNVTTLVLASISLFLWIIYFVALLFALDAFNGFSRAQDCNFFSCENPESSPQQVLIQFCTGTYILPLLFLCFLASSFKSISCNGGFAGWDMSVDLGLRHLQRQNLLLFQQTGILYFIN